MPAPRGINRQETSMSGLVFITVIANLAIFSFLGALAWSTGRRDENEPVRFLAWALSLACWAFVLEAATDLTLLVVRLGWLSGGAQDLVVETWYLGESLASAALGVMVVSFTRRVDLSLRVADRGL